MQMTKSTRQINSSASNIQNDSRRSIRSNASSTLSQIDNGILFLDNEQRIVNPINVRTPPPPKWGEPIEEDYWDPNEEFYNHEKAREEMSRRKKSNKPLT